MSSALPPELIACVRELNARGFSAGEIAKELGMTRAAVCGLRWRLKIKSTFAEKLKRAHSKPKKPRRTKGSVIGMLPRLPSWPRARRPYKPGPPTLPAKHISASAASLLALPKAACRYPLVSGLFCGAKRWHHRTPYCQDHSLVCGTFYYPRS